jgi:Domain of unknown function (DUF4911)
VIAIRIKVAPRDIVRLLALCEGYDGLGVPVTLDARRGLLSWCVPEASRGWAHGALAAAATRVPCVVLADEGAPVVRS